MHIKKLLLLIFTISTLTTFGQQINGIVLDKDSKKPIAYANIGIRSKNMGTVTDDRGRFQLSLNPNYNDDTLLISIIGYKPLLLKVADLSSKNDNKILLQSKDYELAEVVIRPKSFRQRTLGVTTSSPFMTAGFKDNILGHEYGLFMKVKKTAFIKQVNINICECSYDTIFYRLNIYKSVGEDQFENILKKPIYLEMPKDLTENEIQIDLQSENIAVEGDFLITLEHVKDLGPGRLFFCAGLRGKTYFRFTSQASWDQLPVGISISTIVDIEK